MKDTREIETSRREAVLRMRRTKILATLGPASRELPILEELARAGMDAVRLNFSHGTHAAHAETFARVREASVRVEKPIAILQDLQGPKIRIGLVKGSMDVPTGSTLIITTRPLEGENGVVSTEYTPLARDVRAGDKILLDEGRVGLRVREVRNAEDIITDVEYGGVLTSKKGINVPTATLTASAMTPKDEADVRFGLDLGVDFVALSFVRRASDVEELREVMRRHGRVVPIIAKIEKPQAMDVLEDIVRVSDGLMVARGDLGVEVPLEYIPAYQKRIIRAANDAGKLVITATQMLESMRENPIPTRAEVTDVANAVLDGTDAVMLSGETAIGKYPVESVRRMAAIAATAEDTLYPFDRPVRGAHPHDDLISSALSRAAGLSAKDVGAKAIVVLTKTGRSAMLVSDERPRAPILAFSPSNDVVTQLALYWGVRPYGSDNDLHLPELIDVAERLLQRQGVASAGDPIVYLAGSKVDLDAARSVRILRVGDREA
jgi:pyruvate kinase